MNTGEIHIVTGLRPEGIGAIVRYHDEYYAEHYGFNHDFGRYVEKPLTDFYNRNSPVERIWLLKDNEGIKGCVALAGVTSEEAQLRWFYVDESLRGRGYGQKLISLLVDFAVEKGYRRIILWTVSLLAEARRLYEKNGFTLEEEQVTEIWGRVLTEQKFALGL